MLNSSVNINFPYKTVTFLSNGVVSINCTFEKYVLLDSRFAVAISSNQLLP
jgi:hypothetical protein